MTLLTSVTAFAILGLFQHAYHPTTTTRYGEGAWVLSVEEDAFTMQTKCSLANRNGRDPDVTADKRFFAFHFSTKLDTSDAWYKVGSSPPRRWEDIYAQLVQEGSIGQAEHLDNATNGAVLIPISVMNGVDVVLVRPSPRIRPVSFDLRGANLLLAASSRLHCSF